MVKIKGQKQRQRKEEKSVQNQMRVDRGEAFLQYKRGANLTFIHTKDYAHLGQQCLTQIYDNFRAVYVNKYLCSSATTAKYFIVSHN